MKKYNPKNYEELIILIKHLNFLHDGCLTKINFIKKRKLNEKGDLVYLDNNLLNTNINIELLLNSYLTAQKNQKIILKFKNVESFTFFQHEDFDYSDLYELKITNNKLNYIFTFFSSPQKTKFLIICCSQFTCIEK